MTSVIALRSRRVQHRTMANVAASAWTAPGMVRGFSTAPPNRTLLDYAAPLQARRVPLRVLDIGCGAGRNAVPLAQSGARVVGTDLSWPMLLAAADRDTEGRLHLVHAPMHALPIRDRTSDLIVAHGIWNLAGSGIEFRRAVREAARAAVPGARLFVFTFSRHTLMPDAKPVAGETFVYTAFSGQPQVFLTEGQLVAELRHAGFEPDPDLPLREHNRPALSKGRALAVRVEGPPRGEVRIGGGPVIYEGGFRFSGEL